jgi:hypothetical protein
MTVGSGENAGDLAGNRVGVCVDETADVVDAGDADVDAGDSERVEGEFANAT